MINSKDISVIVLAAGKGTRMESNLPKVLHKIGDKPVVYHILNRLDQLGLTQINLVIGHQGELVQSELGSKWSYIVQEKPLGTADAVKSVLPYLEKNSSTILVFNGDDSAFFSTKTIQNNIEMHLKSGSKMTILTTIKKNVDISGRVIRDHTGKIASIKPNSQMTGEELSKNNELVCGFYIFDRAWLENKLPQVQAGDSGEYNITKLIDFALKEEVLNDIILDNSNEWQSVNTPRELKLAQKLWKEKYGNSN